MKRGAAGRCRQVWAKLVSPAALVPADQRLSAQLLSAVLLVLVIAGLGSGIVQLAFVPGFWPTFVPMIVALATLAGTYWMSRTRRWRIAAAVASLIPIVATAGVAISNPNDRVWFAFMMIGVLLATTFLSLRMAAAVGGLAIAVIVGLALGVPEFANPSRIVPQLAFHGVFTPMLLIAAAHRARVAKQREAALRESEQRYADLVGNASDGIFTLDSASRFIDCNPATATILGVPSGDLVGKTLADLGLLSVESLDELRTSFKQLIRGGHPTQLITALRRSDGSELWVESAGRVVVRPDGITLEAIMRDITRRVRAEREREELTRQLDHARRLETIGQLAGGVAHDFNNLLTVTLISTEILQRRHPADKELKDIQAASERAAALTSNLLAFARRQVMSPTILDPNALIRGLESILVKLVGANITLELALSDELGVIEADPTQIEQVIVNLVANARDAQPNGGRIRVATAPRTTQGIALVELTVTDHGPGMDPATAEQVFEPFFTTRTSGTGLGLATVYGIVKQSGGTIDVVTPPGHGATFRVVFPRAQRAAAEPAEPEDSHQPPTLVTVLLIEDEPVVRRATAAVLRAAGFEVVEACDATEAITVHGAHREEIRLVVSDVVLPGLSGPEIVACLARPDLPVVFMSGYAADVASANGIAFSTATFLQKPFSSKQLLAATEVALRSQQS